MFSSDDPPHLSDSHFSEEEINASLEEDSKDSPYEVAVSYSSTGEDFNSYRYLKEIASEDKQVFRHTESKALAYHKKKVIYCALTDSALKRVEIGYFASLIMHRALYLRVQDEKGKASIRGPYRQLKDFLKDREYAQASKQQVLHSLGEHHLSADNFIILDQTKYSKALKMLSNKKDLGRYKHEDGFDYPWISDEDLQFLKNQSPDTLDLCFLPIVKFKKIADVVDKDKIKSVKLYCPCRKEIKELLKLFPNLDTIEVPGASKYWVDSILSSWFPLPRKLNLILTNYQSNSLCLPSTVELNLLMVTNAEASQLQLDFSANLGGKVRVLSFEGWKNTGGEYPWMIPPLSFNLYHLNGLTELHINNCYLASNNVGYHSYSYYVKVDQVYGPLFIFPKKNNIQILKIKNSDGLSNCFDFSCFQALEEFTFIKSSWSILKHNFLISDPGCFSSLNCFQDEDLLYPHLRKVEIDDSSDLDLTKFSGQRSRVLARYVSSESVRKITLNAIEFNRREFTFLVERYKKVNLIVVKKPTAKWVEQCLYKIPDRVSVVLDDFQDEKLVLPKMLHIDSLKIVNAQKLTTIMAASSSYVKQLEIENCSLLDRCNLLMLANLQSLIFRQCKKSISLLVSEETAIRELIVEECGFFNFDFINFFQKLEKLRLNKTDSTFFQIVTSYVLGTEKSFSSIAAKSQESAFEDHCLRDLIIDKPEQPEQKDNDEPLDLRQFSKLKTATLSKHIKAELPPKAIRSDVDVSQIPKSYKYPIINFNPYSGVEIWTASGERMCRTRVNLESFLFTDSVYSCFYEWYYPRRRARTPQFYEDIEVQKKEFKRVIEDISLVTELETLLIHEQKNGLYWPLSKFNASGLVHLKRITLNIQIVDTDHLKMDFSNCRQLQALEIRVELASRRQPVTLNLQGCSELYALHVYYDGSARQNNDDCKVHILGLRECTNLHYADIHAVNAGEYAHDCPLFIISGKLPPLLSEIKDQPVPSEAKVGSQSQLLLPPAPPQEPFDPTFIIDFCKRALKVILAGGLLVELFSLLLSDQGAQSIGIDNAVRTMIVHSSIPHDVYHAIAVAASAIWDFILALPSYLYTVANLVWNFIEAIPDCLSSATHLLYSNIINFPILNPVLLACTATCLLIYIAYQYFPSPFNRVTTLVSDARNGLANIISSAHQSLVSNNALNLSNEAKNLTDEKPSNEKKEPTSTTLKDQGQAEYEKTQKELKLLQAEEKRQEELIARKKQQAYNKFFNALIAKTERKPLRSLVEDILETKTKKSLVPLIELKADQSPMEIDGHIIRQLNEWKPEHSIDHHLYIHNPREFLEYYRPGKVEKGRIVPEENGPLRRFFSDKDAKKVLVINLSTFSPKQRGGLQSLLDKQPFITVGNEKKSETIYLPDNLQVVLLVSRDASLGEAFRSRCQSWILHEDFTHQVEKKQLTSEPASLGAEGLDERPAILETKEIKEVEVNVRNNPAWEDAIGLEIIFEDQEAKISEDSALLKAWNENRPLIVYNAPKNESFDRFLHRVNVERTVDLFKGKLEKVPTGFYIKIMTKNEESSLMLDNVKVFSRPEDEKEFAKHEREYLNIQNIHRCYKEMWIDEKGHAKSARGLLDSYDPSRQVFYIVGAIKQCYWEKLIDEIKRKYATKQFSFILAPGASIEGVAKRNPLPIQDDVKEVKKQSLSLESKAVYGSNVYVSNDPGLLAETLAKKYNGLVIDVYPSMSFGDLMYEMECQSSGGFKYSIRSILGELTKEKTIVLNGALSVSVYMRLLPIIDRKPESHGHVQTIACNGKKFTITGQLILVMPNHMKERLSPLPVQEFFYQWSDYHGLLDHLDSRNRELLNQIEQFYKLANRLPQQREGRPEKPYCSYYRLVKMLAALKQKNPLHSSNPIKDIFLYDYPKNKDNYHDMEDYAYFNVVGKYLFDKELKTDQSNSVRVDKLKKFKELFKIKSRDDIKKHALHLLNCFNGPQIRNILDSSLDDAFTFYSFPTLKLKTLIKLEEVFNSYTAEEENLSLESERSLVKEEPSKLSRYSKQQNHFKYQMDNERLIILIGPPGAGKTHTVRQLLGVSQYYEGEEGCIQWLENGDRPLFWDEFNMATELQLIIWGALRRDDKRVRYFNKEKGIDTFYDLAKHKPVIAAGNPVGGEGARHFLQVTQDIGVMIYFESPSNEFYLYKILNPRLGDSFKEYSEDFLFAFHLLKKYNQFIRPSSRNLKDLVRCFFSLLRKHDFESKERVGEILLRACELIFSGLVKGASERKKFVEELRQHFKLPVCLEQKQASSLIQLTDNIFIPSSKRYFVDAIERFLHMRLETLIECAKVKSKKGELSEAEVASLDTQTQMVIVEGAPGLGKSTYLRAIVEKYRKALKERAKELQLLKDDEDSRIELEVINEELKKITRVISLGLASVNTMLIEAQKNEEIVIGDEGNLDESVEALTNQLLGGVDEKRRPVDRRGFAYMRSQNASSEEGRPSASPADLNRSLFIYKDSYDDADLEEFVANKGVLEYPESYRKAYREAVKQRPEINMRTFHVTLDEVAREFSFAASGFGIFAVPDSRHQATATESLRP